MPLYAIGEREPRIDPAAFVDGEMQGERRKRMDSRRLALAGVALLALLLPALSHAQVLTDKPVLYGRNWVAITGKPLAATAGAKIFMQGGNAVDATCAMLAAAATMPHMLSYLPCRSFAGASSR